MLLSFDETSTTAGVPTVELAVLSAGTGSAGSENVTVRVCGTQTVTSAPKGSHEGEHPDSTFNTTVPGVTASAVHKPAASIVPAAPPAVDDGSTNSAAAR